MMEGEIFLLTLLWRKQVAFMHFGTKSLLKDIRKTYPL